MLKSALIFGIAAAAAGSTAPDQGRAERNGFVLFSGGIPALQINTGTRACPFEAPKASSARRSKPVFTAY